MNKDTLLDEAMRLPIDERLQLIVDIWDSLIDDQTWMPSAEQLEEARLRFEELRRNPSIAIPAERLLARLQSRFG
jgi:putative addiction module component (TIGR02574 family)